MADLSRSPLPPVPTVALTVLLLLVAGAAAARQGVGPYTAPPDPAAESARRAAVAAAPHLAQSFGLAPLAELAPAASAAAADLAQLQAWNAAGRLPLEIGFTRALPAQRVHLDAPPDAADAAVVSRDGGVLARTGISRIGWGGSIRVRGAHRLRLHLAAAALPEGARLWVHGAGGTAGPVGGELIAADGGLWTPSIEGEDLALDVEMPAAALAAGSGYGFTIDQVLELVPESDLGLTAKDTSCEVDASCYAGSFDGYQTARHAVAELEFLEGRQGYACTGQLLNDSASDGTPYLLTANHCISTQPVASTLEAFFDDYTPTCNGFPPALDSLPRSAGAKLLATATAAASSDFALLLLSNLPTGRTFLGWDSLPSATPNNTYLYRISHPATEAQRYSVTTVDTQSALCSNDYPLPRYIYSDLLVGAAAPGSSGSAAMLSSGEVVGQLFGGCGTDDSNVCDPGTHPLDGAFANSFAALAPFLSPGAPKRCVPGSLALCLDSRRFQVMATWSNQFNNTSGVAHAIVGTDQVGYFYFTDPSNFELMVKILDFGSEFKVYYGELTDLNFTITIADTVTGLTKTYTNTAGNCGGIDNTGFPESAPEAAPAPAEAAPAVLQSGEKGSCAPNSSTLCLLGRRFAVGVTWMNQFSGQSGTGVAGRLSDLSGLFTFSSASDIELVVKVVQFPSGISFYYGSLSNLQYTITVTDTTTGTVKTYNNPAGTYCGGLDSDAFPP